MSGFLNSNHNGSTANFPDSTEGPFASSFSGQSAPAPGFHHSGLHNIHGNFNLRNMRGSLAPRNAAMSGLPSSGIQQPLGSITSGRFASNNHPVAISQIPHGHSRFGDRGMNIGGGPEITSGMNAIGGSLHGISSDMGTSVSHRSLHGMSASPMLANLGPQITSSVGNAVVGRNTGRIIRSSGLSMPGIPSHMNLSGNVGSGNLNLHGSNGIPSGMLPQASRQLLGNYNAPYGGTLLQSQVHAGNNFVGSMGMLQNVNSSDISPFGASNFPQLIGLHRSAGDPQGQYGLQHKQGVGVNTIVQPNQEFSFQNDDFPLPGYKDSALELRNNAQYHENVPMMQAPHYPMARGFNSVNSHPLNRPSHLQGVTSQQISSAIESYRDQSHHRFGLLGLLRLQNLKDPDLATLALGMDLTELGLNMESSDNLYSTFNSPWTIELTKEPDYHIPACYSFGHPALQPIHFQNFGIRTLFYIFYSMPRDEAQLYAANELYNQGWLYHRELRMWLKRIENLELEKTDIYERGSYDCFDPNIWNFIRKDNFVFYYKAMEKRPILPSAGQNVR